MAVHVKDTCFRLEFFVQIQLKKSFLVPGTGMARQFLSLKRCKSVATVVQPLQAMSHKHLIKIHRNQIISTALPWRHKCDSRGRKLLFNSKHWFLPLSQQRFSSSTSEVPASSPELVDELVDAAMNVSTVSNVSLVAEPSFMELGLSSPWTPVGILQSALESLHITCDLPWWSSIAIVTVILRCLTFPIMIAGRRSMAHMSNHMPHMVIMQQRISQARMQGNSTEASILAIELSDYLKKHKVNPLTGAFIPMLQAPFFISMFFALRSMANLPVESLKSGGLFWFVDLTVPDPIYALPLLTSATLLVVIEVGAETGVKSKQMGVMKNVMRALPFVFLPITIKFPAAVLTYWFTNNIITLCQALVLKQPGVKEWFGIPPIVPPPDLPTALSGQTFGKGLYEALSNANIANEVKDRQRVGALKIKPNKSTQKK